MYVKLMKSTSDPETATMFQCRHVSVARYLPGSPAIALRTLAGEPYPHPGIELTLSGVPGDGERVLRIPEDGEAIYVMGENGKTVDAHRWPPAEAVAAAPAGGAR